MDKIKKLIYKGTFGYTCLPTYLAINISNVCNRRCSFCPYHSPTLADNEHYRWFRRQPKFINLAPLEKWLKGAGRLKHISITGKGEPMLHPYFEFLCRTIDNFCTPWSITTNGDLLTYDRLWFLERMHYLSGIRISVYDDDFKWNHETTIPVTFFNQTGKHRDGMIDGYTVYCDGNSVHSIPKDFNDKPCRTPWSFATINTDGSIVPCYSFNEIGNINEPFGSVWNNDAARKFRRDAIRCRAEHSDCKNCGVNL